MPLSAVLAIVALFLAGISLGCTISNVIFVIKLLKELNNSSNSGNSGKDNSNDN